MRLLNIHSLEFTLFLDNIPKYVIASHRWQGIEATKKDVEKRRNTDTAGYKKVVAFAEYVKAKLHGIDWLWVDTCCIDKKNSAELNESINSMFKWYHKSQICLAYLADVGHGEDFTRSVWFRRGWTLQELLAPDTVLFLDCDWQVIGHKSANTSQVSFELGPSIMPQLAIATSISEEVLRDYNKSKDLGIEERLRWMSGRETTRAEDMSYCLYGIFDVTQGANYGEGGDRARRRLMQELKVPIKPAMVMPVVHDSGLVDRESLDAEIRAMAAPPAAWLALVGLGGVGKTQLATKHARSVWDSQDTWVFWIHASSAARFDDSIRDVATVINLIKPGESRSDILELIRHWLADQQRKWLIILDNADQADFLLKKPNGHLRRRIDYIPASINGKVIVTSRSKHEALKLVHLGNMIDVKVMTEEEAVSLVLKRLGQSTDQVEALQLVQALNCLPVALTQATAFIQRRPLYSVKRYLEETSGNADARARLLTHTDSLPGRDHEANNGVLTTWQISFQHIDESHKSAADLLAYMSLCDCHAMPRILLDYTTSDTAGINHGDADTKTDFEQNISVLMDFSFVMPTTSETIWEMHPLVQEACRLWLHDDERLVAMRWQLGETLLHRLPGCVWDDWWTTVELMPHVTSAGQSLPREERFSLQWSDLLNRTSGFHLINGNSSMALDMANESLHLRQSILGNEDLRTLWCRSRVAYLHTRLGDPRTAIKMQEELLKDYTRKYGERNIATAEAMRVLAYSYTTSNNYEAAEALFLKAMALLIDMCEPGDKVLRSVRGELANLYYRSGRCHEARVLGERVLDDCIKQLGRRHAETLRWALYLACTLSAMGAWREAISMAEQSLPILTNVYGRVHAHTIWTMTHLAEVQCKAGNYNASKQLALEAVLHARKITGNEGIRSKTMNTLSQAHAGLLEWKEAEERQRSALAQAEQAYGRGSRSALRAMASLASTCRATGRLQESEALAVEVLQAREQRLGLKHYHTLMIKHSLASTIFLQGRCREAITMSRAAVAGLIEANGAEHPDTIKAVQELSEMEKKAAISTGAVDSTDVDSTDTRENGTQHLRERFQSWRRRRKDRSCQ